MIFIRTADIYHCDEPVVVQIVRTFDFTFYWFCLLGLWPSNLYYYICLECLALSNCSSSVLMRTVVPSYYYYYQVGSPNCQKEEIILNFTLNTLDIYHVFKMRTMKYIIWRFLKWICMYLYTMLKEVIQIYMFKEHSYLCTLSEIKYICNTYTTGDIQFIFMSFNNRYVSGMFRSECKLILYFPTVCVYCVYPAMPKIQNQLSNCLIKAETVVVLIVFWWCPLWSPRL